MKKIINSILAFSAALIILLSGCQSSAKYIYTQFFSMDTVIELQSDSDSGTDEVEKYTSELEKNISASIADSEISKLNATGYASLSPEIYSMLEKAAYVSDITDGAFDLCSGALVKLWNITSENPKIPSDEDIKNALKSCGAEKLTLHDGKSELKNKSAVDPGGFAKGYAAQKCIEILKNNGVKNAMISFGGNVAVTGSSENNAKDGKNGWNIGIKNPDNTSGIIGYTRLCDTVIAVSGDYERYFEKDGVRYHHIFDTKTGYPADSSLRSAAVICDDGLYADAFSTALFVMGPRKALEFYNKKLIGFEAVLICGDGTVYITDGLYGDFISDGNAVNSDGRHYVFKPLSDINS